MVWWFASTQALKIFSSEKVSRRDDRVGSRDNALPNLKREITQLKNKHCRGSQAKLNYLISDIGPSY